MYRMSQIQMKTIKQIAKFRYVDTVHKMRIYMSLLLCNIGLYCTIEIMNNTDDLLKTGISLLLLIIGWI